MGDITESRSVAYDGAESVQVKIKMASGKVNVSGGAETLMGGTFTYADPMWKPVVAYEVEGGVGTLKVKQPKIEGPHAAAPKYVWDLTMGNAVPMSFGLKLASGSADLRMAETRLSKLDVKVASGNVKADLTGDQADLTRVSLHAASGCASLVLDGSYPVLETIDLGTASGPIDVTLAGDYPALRTLKVGSASGKVSIKLSGNCPVLHNLDVNLASGRADLGLAGATLPHGKVKLSCVSGKAVVVVPSEAPAVINFTALSGKLVAPGFQKRDKDYVNDAYMAAEAEAGVEGALRLSMSSVSGKLVVQSPEVA
jgi:uncharacterized protein DUF2154